MDNVIISIKPMFAVNMEHICETHQCCKNVLGQYCADNGDDDSCISGLYCAHKSESDDPNICCLSYSYCG